MDDFISCTHCSFNNDLGITTCQMCQLPLFEETAADAPVDFASINLLPTVPAAPAAPAAPKIPVAPKMSEGEKEKNRIFNANYDLAMEYIPESFTRAPMLYIYGNINGHVVPIFIDSGAQITLMSKSVAERFGLSMLIDPLHVGTAVGVGTQKIVGKIYAAEILLGEYEDDGAIKIETAVSLLCPLTILEDGPEFIIFGIDQLRLHRMQINFRDNVVEIGDSKIKFLSPDKEEKIKFMELKQEPEKDPVKEVPEVPTIPVVHVPPVPVEPV
jgi:hypothetical protein